MGLELLPHPIPPNSKKLPEGMVHLKAEPCPFKDDGNPHGILTSCCSFRGSETAFYLLALGFTPFLLRLHEDKLPEEALEFADELRRTAQRLCDSIEKKAAEDQKGTDMKAPSDLLDEAEMVVPGLNWSFKLGQAHRALESAAAWHEKVAKMHCGVDAWF